MSDLLWMYYLVFTQLTLGLVFTTSAITKLRDMSAFIAAIENFQILPRRFAKAWANILLVGESSIAALIFAGDRLLVIGFLLAILLLIIFSTAIIYVLWRGIQTPCACFGSSQRRTSPADFWRNISFLVIAFVGIGVLSTHPAITVKLSLGEIGVLAIMAIVYVVISVNLSEVIELFRFMIKE
jgi:Methylamine utilisation protein MauE